MITLYTVRNHYFIIIPWRRLKKALFFDIKETVLTILYHNIRQKIYKRDPFCKRNFIMDKIMVHTEEKKLYIAFMKSCT